MTRQQKKIIYQANYEELFDEVNVLACGGFDVNFITQISPLRSPDMTNTFVCDWMIIYSK